MSAHSLCSSTTPHWGRGGTTVLIFMRSCQHSPQPGLHGDKPPLAATLSSAFASLTLRPLLSLSESPSQQNHPHRAYDLIRTQTSGVCWIGGRAWAGSFVTGEPQYFVMLHADSSIWFSSPKKVCSCAIIHTSASRGTRDWFLQPFSTWLALSWHSRHCEVF